MHSCTIVMHSRTIVMHSRTIVKWNLCTDALIKLKWLRLDRGARIRPELFWKCTGSRETKPRKPNVYPVKKTTFATFSLLQPSFVAKARIINRTFARRFAWLLVRKRRKNNGNNQTNVNAGQQLDNNQPWLNNSSFLCNPDQSRTL